MRAARARRAARGLVMACHPEPTAAVTAVTALLSAAAGARPATVGRTAAAVLAGQLSIGWCNDAVDARRDRRAARRDKPVARGDVSAGAVAAAAGGALAACAVLSRSAGAAAARRHLPAVALAWGYDLGLKATPLSALPYVGAFGLLPGVVTGALPGGPWPPWWATAAGALLGAGAHFANALPDLADDAATGVRGLPHRLGEAGSRRAAAGLLLAASAVLSLAPEPPGAADVAVLGAAAGVLVLGVGRPGPPGSRRPFRAVLALALADVALLVARGRGLAPADHRQVVQPPARGAVAVG